MASSAWQALLAPGRSDDCFLQRPAAAFDPAPAVWSWAQGLWLAELARLAYRDDGRGAALAGVGLAEVLTVDERSAHALVVGPADATAAPFSVVAFRGTDDLRDWLANVRALPVRFVGGGNVHRGFRRALTKVWRPLRRCLRARAGPVVLTGHSLGGAMALLAGALLRPATVCTFGAPRAGDAAFARALDGVAVQRVENGRDLVPRLLIPGFVHVGARRHLGADDAAAAVRPEQCRWYDPPPALADHAPLRYVEAIRAAAAREAARG